MRGGSAQAVPIKLLKNHRNVLSGYDWHVFDHYISFDTLRLSPGINNKQIMQTDQLIVVI